MSKNASGDVDLEIKIDPNSKSTISYRSESSFSLSSSSASTAHNPADPLASFDGHHSIIPQRLAPPPARRHVLNSAEYRAAIIYDYDERQKDQSRKVWTIFFLVTLFCFIVSIISISSSAIYRLPSSVNSEIDFRYGYFRGCILIAPPGWELNATLQCDTYSQLEIYANHTNITDFTSPSGLNASQAFSVLSVISISAEFCLLILLVRSSPSNRLLIFFGGCCIWTLVDTLLALLCLVETNMQLMFGGAFEVFIIICMTLQAITALLLVRRGQQFAGICSTADSELVRKLSRL